MKIVQNERPPCLQNNRESWDSGGGEGRWESVTGMFSV